MEILQTVWFGLIGVLLAGFMICGGSDFGAEMLLCATRHRARRLALMDSIAPFWDGNQVWLITAGGALFAAFPRAYSAALSSLYIPTILALVFMIFRAVAIEFFLSRDGILWRNSWAAVCCVSAWAAAALFGAAVGAMFSGTGFPAPADGFFGNPSYPFSTESLAFAALVLVYFLVQGAYYVALKNPQDSQFCGAARLLSVAMSAAYLGYLAFLALGTARVRSLWIMAAFLLCYIPLSAAMKFARAKKFAWGFAMNSIFAALCTAAHFAASYPYLISPKGGAGVSIFDASSSAATLEIMLGAALVGAPLAVSYFIYAHFVFSRRGEDGRSY